MSCFHPSFVQREVDKSTGLVTSHWLGGSSSLLKFPAIAKVLKDNYNGDKTLNLPQFFTVDRSITIIQVPCGKCIGCRMDYSRSWADRMTYHVIGKKDYSYFLTLTYDDVHLDDLEHSDNYDLYSTNLDHVSAFIKKLRNRFRDDHIDYFYSSEYGDNSFRPHYHMILYNLFIPDLHFWKCNDNGDPIYTSEIIDKLWGRGFVTVSHFSWRGAAYTASYVEKKRDGRMLCEYTAVGLEPEKCRMSRRPGIAYDYYCDNAADLWNNNGLAVDRDVNSSGKLGLPRYFRKLAEKHGIGLSEFYEFQKRSLERSNILTPLKVENTSFDLDRIGEMLMFEEREVLSQQKNKKIY